MKVRVNDVLWDRADDVVDLNGDQRFVAQVAEDQTTLQFGDGVHGVRLPSGIENVRAVYRTGIGSGGNVEINQISQLPSPVLGVRTVSNPVRSSGGVDPENVFQGRLSTGRFPTALDRVVSLRDYEDFARNFGGIAKSIARQRIENGRTVVEVIVAAGGDAPLEPGSLLLRNLQKSLDQASEANVQVRVSKRHLKVLFVRGTISVDPRLEAERVLADVRTALLDHFSFERVALGRDVPRSEILTVIQRVAGVQSVNIERFDGIPEEAVEKLLAPGTNGDQSQLKFITSEQFVPVRFGEIAFFPPTIQEAIDLEVAS